LYLAERFERRADHLDRGRIDDRTGLGVIGGIPARYREL
jgi:hypothetical protein